MDLFHLNGSIPPKLSTAYLTPEDSKLGELTEEDFQMTLDKLKSDKSLIIQITEIIPYLQRFSQSK